MAGRGRERLGAGTGERESAADCGLGGARGGRARRPRRLAAGRGVRARRCPRRADRVRRHSGSKTRAGGHEAVAEGRSRTPLCGFGAGGAATLGSGCGSQPPARERRGAVERAGPRAAAGRRPGSAGAAGGGSGGGMRGAGEGEKGARGRVRLRPRPAGDRVPPLRPPVLAAGRIARAPGRAGGRARASRRRDLEHLGTGP